MKTKISVLIRNAALVLCCVFLCVSCNKDKKEALAATEAANTDEGFYVLSCDPAEELPHEVKFPVVYVQFSKSVVPLTQLGTPSDKSDVFSIEPKPNGVFRWYGTSLLCFEFSDEAVPQHEYKVTVNPKLTSVTGEKLTGETNFSFRTEDLSMTSIIPGYGSQQAGTAIEQKDVPLKDAKDIAVFFSWPINPKVTGEYVAVRDEHGKEYKTSTEGIEGYNALRITVGEELPEDTDIFVVLKEGAKSEKEYAGKRVEQLLDFHTLKPFSAMAMHYTDLRSWGKYANPVRLRYTHQLSADVADSIVKNVTTTPPMPITKDNVEVAGRTVLIYGLPVTYEQSYKINVPAGVISDIHGRKIAKEAVIDVTVPAAASSVAFKDYGNGILEAQFEPAIAFRRQNIEPGSAYRINGQTVKTYAKADIPRNENVTETVPLKKYLTEVAGRYYGHAFFDATMKVKAKYYDGEEYDYEHNNSQTLQVTDLGATVRFGYNKAVVLVTSLETGKPVAGADVAALRVDGDTDLLDVLKEGSAFFKEYRGPFSTVIATGKTDANGLAVIPFKDGVFSALFQERKNWRYPQFFIEVVNNQDRLVFNADINSPWKNGINRVLHPREAEDETQRTFMFTDRDLYKPGETVTFRGIDRTLKLGDYSPYAGGAYTVIIGDDLGWRNYGGRESYEESSSSRNAPKFAEFKGITTASGGFWHKWKIPEDLEPGTYQIEYQRNGEKETKVINFTVAYFERLRFEAHASIPDDIIYTRGERIDAQVAASYLGGGSLAKSTFFASWYREPIGFKPTGKQFDKYRFGPLQGYDNRSYLGEEAGVLGTNGNGSASITSGSEQLKGMAYQYRVAFDVTDSGGQRISSSASATVHPAKYYIGLSSANGGKGFAKKGDALTFDFILTQADGSDVSNAQFPVKKDARNVNVELLREEWKAVQQMGVDGTINTRYVREMVCEQKQQLPLKASSFTVTPPKGGVYIVRLSSTDNMGNDVVTEQRFYASGSDWAYYGDSGEELELIASKDEYEVGETAELMLKSPLPKGTYLMTIEREGIFSEQLLDITEPVTVLDIPVKAEYLPIAYVSLSSFSNRTGEASPDFDTPDLNKPKGYFGIAPIHVSTKSMNFDVRITSDKKAYRPGETATITLRAEKNGVPVPNAELTLMAVDRGVIDLVDYHVPDPIEYFYSEYMFPLCTRGGDSRSLLIDPVTYSAKSLFGGDSATDDAKSEERKNFEPTAVFEPALITGADGTVQCTFTWPDNLTAYRVTALGVRENNFALTESEISVTNPISVRDVLPRRLRVNDVSEAGVVISNLEDTAQKVSVSIELIDGVEQSADEESGMLKPAGSAVLHDVFEQTIIVDPNSTLPLMFPLTAKREGFITVRFTVKSNLVNERIIKPLEIDRPYIYETVTTVGQTESGNSKNDDDKVHTATEKIVIPGGVADGRGNLTVQLDPSRLGVLKEAVNYVFRYPYGCLEQRSSAILPLIYFGDYIKAFGLENEVSKPKKVVEKELKYWASLQKADGGFPYWPNDPKASFAVSLRVGEVIAAAMEKDIDIPKNLNVKRLADFIESKMSYKISDKKLASDIYQSAYAMYVLTRLNHAFPHSPIDQIVTNPNSDITSLCFAGMMYLARYDVDNANEVAKQIRSYLKPTTRGVDITSRQERWSSWQYYSAENEAYPLVLKFLTQLNSEDPMISRLVYQLLERQKAGNGYWHTTASTARVLDALNTYIIKKELTDTDFSAEALIDGKKFLSGKFKGVAAESVEKVTDFEEEPIKSIARDTEVPIEFSKKGTGTLFYTVSMKYAIPAENQFARDEGLCLFVEYIDVKTGKPVTENKLEAGKTYRAKVTLTTNRDRTFVALRVPIPSGAEVLNAAFVTTGSLNRFVPEDEQREWNYGLSSQTIYDNEVQYFWDFFRKGRQQVDFIFRAVRSGMYETPSATAECMYESEIFGRSSGKVIVIE